MDHVFGELRGSLNAALHSIDEKSIALAQAEKNIEESKASLKRKWGQVEAKEKEVAEREQEVESKCRRLEEEKEAMTKLGAGRNDLIGLNFGGEKMLKVKRSLLLQFEETMLARMFSGRHDDSLDRDEHGNYFLDFSPRVMCPLIDFLRLNRDLPPEPVPLPEIPQEDQAAWRAMVKFFGLEEVFFPLPTFTLFSGIKENVKISDLQGWTLFFCKPYSHESTMNDFVPPDVALRGGALLVGARRAGADVLALGAMGNADVVTTVKADDTTTFHNGAHWYCMSHCSVGFSPCDRVDLTSADTEDQGSPLRLSWHLCGMGGWRAGAATHLDDSADWEKVIFATPFKIPEGAGSA